VTTSNHLISVFATVGGGKRGEKGGDARRRGEGEGEDRGKTGVLPLQCRTITVDSTGIQLMGVGEVRVNEV